MADTTRHPPVHDLRIAATPEQLAKAILKASKKPR